MVKIEISGKLFMVILAVCIVSSFAVGLTFQNILFPAGRHKPQHVGANVFVTVETPMGVQAVSVGNVITDIGEQEAAKRFQSTGTYNATKYISIGNATVSQTLTKLTVEFDRQEGTVSNLWIYNGDAAFNVTKKFTFTGTVTLNAVGIHWNPTVGSDGNMYACANFQQTTFGANWNLTITWILVFDGN
jgi:hypothetical protein